MENLKGKTIVIGISGGIASYKIANLVSMLVKSKADVHTIMTKNACNFINPITFETLTGNKCLIDTFDRNFEFDINHISLAKKADLIMVAPATANVIAKISNGIADDILTTTILASNSKKFIAPSMNTAMYENPITQRNIETLRAFGFNIIEPSVGLLACKDIGKGKLPEPEILYSFIENELAREKDLLGKNILISAGATKESIDPVRYITNHSTGKMGIALAKEASMRGANVTLVKAHTTVKVPEFVKVIEVKSSEEMFLEITKRAKEQDIIIKAAAVSDYTPKTVADEKLKKSSNNLEIQLKKTNDILKFLGENKRENQFICGFSMETENMIENSKAKLERKNADLIIANNLKEEGCGFGTDTNGVTFISKSDIITKKLMKKEEVAKEILDYISNVVKVK